VAWAENFTADWPCCWLVRLVPL